MDAKKKLALLITTTMLVASPLYGCGKQNLDEKEEQNNLSGSTHVAPGGYFRNNNSNFKSGSGSKGKSWGTPKSGGSYSHGHGGSIGG